MVLALPFQGVAAAGMLSCMPVTAPLAAPAAGAHDHAAMLHALAAARHDGHDGHRNASTAQAGSHHGDGHAIHDGHDGRHGNGSCASCCIGAAMAPGTPPRLALARPEFVSIPFRPGYLPSVDPSLPERPPRAILA